jgi:hypothetical protein
MEESPPSSFVPADTNLFGPAAHGSMWMIVGVAAGVLGLALLVWCVRKPRVTAGVRTARLTVRERYLAEIDELERQYVDLVIDERELHHRLSTTVRRFAAEHGAPGALAMTPTVLDEVGQPVVAGVVARYQPPQFMWRAACDPDESLASARDVVTRL